MTLALHLPVCPDSVLGRRDPRGKLVAFGVALACVCALRRLPSAGLAFLGVLVLAWLAQTPWRWLFRRLAIMSLPLLVFLLFLPFAVHRGGPAWSWGGVRVSLDGVEAAGLLLLKANTLVALALVLLVATPLPVLLHAAFALRIPGLLVQLVLLTYRYLFVLVDEFRRLRVALRARGYRNRVSRHSYQTLGHVTGTLLIRSQERAERVRQAMRCRGFDGRFRSLAEFRLQRADAVLLVLMVGMAAGLVAADLFLFAE